MSTQAIRDFHEARAAVDLYSTIRIPRTQIDAAIEKVAKLILNLEWALLSTELKELHHQLHRYRKYVCEKTKVEMEAYRSTPLPEILETQLNGLCAGSVFKIWLRVEQMLQDPDLAPFHAQLSILKLRLDEICKNSSGEVDVDLNGILALAHRVINPSCALSELREITVKDIAHNIILSNNVKAMEEHLRSDWGLIFRRFMNLPLLTHVCHPNTLRPISMVQLLIRAGGDVNGGMTSVGHVPSPLEIAFKYNDVSDLPVQKEILQLLLRAGANPNIPMPPPTDSSEGCSSLIYHLIDCSNDQEVDELLPVLVDGGMRVDALQVIPNPDGSEKTRVETPLQYAISKRVRHVDPATHNRRIVPQRLNFIKALVFNNAVVLEEAKRQASLNGSLEHLNKCVEIRDRVIHDLMAPVRSHLPVVLIAKLVASYWTPNVPQMRARCYASFPSTLTKAPSRRALASALCTIC